MENCQKCGSQQFCEEDGFHYCEYCQTQSQGFAKEVATEEFVYELRTKEIRIKNNNNNNGKRKRKEQSDINRRGIRSSWTTFEAFNKIYIEFIRDFFRIIDINGLSFPLEMKHRFISIAMQLWFKYLRESEIAFTVDEHHHESKIRLHPFTRYRDNYLLANNNPSSSSSSMDADDEEIIIPYINLQARNKNKYTSNQSSYGNQYRYMKNEKSQTYENYRYFDDMDPENCGDPRQRMQANRSVNSSRIRTKKINELLLTNGISSTKFVSNSSDTFVNFINNQLSSSNNSFQNQDHHHHRISIKDEPSNDDDDKQFAMDEEQFKNMKKETMSNKSKYMDQHITFDYCKLVKNKHQSPLANDFINKQKILVFLYIVIRLFNFNIYLSDLIRWCTNGSIRYMNLFENFLNENETIMWMDKNHFIRYQYPDYKIILITLRNMIIHCNIDLATIPLPNIYSLIRRYIYDLNLPDGLMLLIRYRYGNFIEYYVHTSFIHANSKKSNLPYYEMVAIVPIILILRDLFNLNTTNDELSYYQFRYSKFANRLFVWNEWLYYSRIRFNLIKAFRLNMRLKNLDVLNLNETLFQSYRMWEFFRDIKIASKHPHERNCCQTRFELQELFEKLNFSNENFEWKTRIKQQQQQSKPSFYPLIDLTKEILDQISNNNDLHNVLNQNFRNKFITPYVCNDDYFNFHRRLPLRFHNYRPFCPYQRQNARTLLSDSIRFLFDISSFITCVDVYGYIFMFSKAEKFSQQN